MRSLALQAQRNTNTKSYRINAFGSCSIPEYVELHQSTTQTGRSSRPVASNFHEPFSLRSSTAWFVCVLFAMASASPPDSPSDAARTKLKNGFKMWVHDFLAADTGAPLTHIKHSLPYDDIVRSLGMSMRDADTNELMWSCGELGDDLFDKTMEGMLLQPSYSARTASIYVMVSYFINTNLPMSGLPPIAAHIPPEILGRKAVARKVRFSSTEVLTKFRMVQKMMLHG